MQLIFFFLTRFLKGFYVSLTHVPSALGLHSLALRSHLKKNIELCPINILIMTIVRIIIIIIIPAEIYLFKVNNKNTRRRCESVQSH